MKLSHLLIQREALLRQARLANLAFAYWHLGHLVARIAAARLHGKVCLQPVDPEAERYWPVLTALEGSQSVVDEHFTDQNIVELADLIVFLTNSEGTDTTFRLEEMTAQFVAPLQRKLEQAGVELEAAALRLVGPTWTGSNT